MITDNVFPLQDTTPTSVEDGEGACTRCCEWWNKTPVGHFLSPAMFCSDTCNLLFAHLLFWTIAVPMVIERGYSTNNIAEAIEKQGNYGELQSGRYGQGAFPILLMLTIVATGIWGSALVG